MIIDCISDLHGYEPKLIGGDLLIIAGDLTSNDSKEAWIAFHRWRYKCADKYKKVIIIAGNHDNALQEGDQTLGSFRHNFEYLCDSGTEFPYQIEGLPEEDEGFFPSGKRSLKIWGSPWTLKFKGQNPKAAAFTVEDEKEMATKLASIPIDTDILITHGPPFGILDTGPSNQSIERKRYGSVSLRATLDKVCPKIHVFGHIHEGHGLQIDNEDNYSINASIVDQDYRHINKPIRISLTNTLREGQRIVVIDRLFVRDPFELS